MSTITKGAKSLVKKELMNQRTPAIGFKKIQFAHKASAGESVIDITALSAPNEMTSRGFVQPSVDEITAAQMLFYRKNLKITSSLRGELQPYLSFKVTSNTSIAFTDDFGTAEEGEIFTCTLDPVAKTGSLVADVERIMASGTVTSGNTDIDMLKSQQLGLNPGEPLGSVMLWLKISGTWTLQERGATKDYQEIDAGNGRYVILRLNSAVGSDTDWMVTPTYANHIRPDGSLNDEIERLGGVIGLLVTDVAVLTGKSEGDYDSAPTYTQLVEFGSILNQKANLSGGNTFSGDQVFDGSVGIGTASPLGKLHSYLNSSGDYAGYFQNDSASGKGVYIQGGGSSSGNYSLYVDDYTGSGNPSFVVDGVGNVGINTITPNSQLSILGAGSPSTDGLRISRNTLEDNEFLTLNMWAGVATLTSTTGTTSNGAIRFKGGGGDTYMEISPSGNVGIGTSSPSALIHAASTAGLAGAIIETSAGSDSELEFINTNGGNATWAIGLDYSDSKNFGIAYAAASGVSLSGGRVFTIDTSGNVGIGTTPASNQKFVVKSGASNSWVIEGLAADGSILGGLYEETGGYGVIDVRDASGTPKVYLNAGGDSYLTGGNVGIGTIPSYLLELATDSAAKPSTNTWTIASDERIKTDVTPFTDGLATVLQLDPINYKYNGKAGFIADGKTNIGFIAQDLQGVADYMVSTYNAKLNEEDEENTELLNYQGHALPFLLVNAIKEQQVIIESKKEEIATLKDQMASVLAGLDALEAEVSALKSQ